MSICQIAASLYDRNSGPTYSIKRLNDELGRLGCNSIIYTTVDAPADFGQENSCFGFRRDNYARGLSGSSSLNRRIAMDLKAGKTNILHCHGLWQLPQVYASNAANRYRVPLVLSPRGALSQVSLGFSRFRKFFFWNMFQRRVLTSTDCFHATSNLEYEDIRRLNLKQPVAIIPNGVDIPPESNEEIPRKKVILYLGRIHPIKGIDLLLQAWSRVQMAHQDWQLWIVGPDDYGYQKKLRKLTNELRCDGIEFRDAVHGNRKVEYYRQASIFALTSYSENFGLTVAEALACETPVLTTSRMPWSESERLGCGFSIESNAESVANALRQLMSLTDEKRAEMGLIGKLWMKSEFDWAVIASKMRDTYLWIQSGMSSHATPPWVVY
jgi:glycosyltransferase involved in cell wall biosynthesis